MLNNREFNKSQNNRDYEFCHNRPARELMCFFTYCPFTFNAHAPLLFSVVTSATSSRSLHCTVQHDNTVEHRM